ncbi:MAG TPA: response regulator [Vicinamibacterales bacterium]|nr:response regulator [Vicinamibacterales bacterium]
MPIKSLWPLSLRVRVLAPAALVAIPAIALLLYTSLERQRQAERTVTQLTQQLASLKAMHQAQLIESTRQLLIAVGNSRDVREGDSETCSAYLRQLLPQIGATYANLGVLDVHGDFKCSGMSLPTMNLAFRPYFQRAIEKRTFVVGEFIIGIQTRKASLPFAYPVLDEAGKVRLVIYAAVDLERLDAAFHHDTDWPSEATMILTDRDHTVLAMHPHGEQWIGKSFKNHPVVLRIGSARAGTLDVESNGDVQVQGFQRVDPLESGLMVRVVISKSQAMAAATWQIYRSLLGFSLAAVLVILGVQMASNRLLLRPIAQLTKASRRLAAGDLGARAASSTTIPELRELGQDFDDMAAAIEERESARLRAEQERKAIEQQYHQSQKMEAVGRLAGGIAHDFNNMLTAILGYCELLLEDPHVGPSQRGDIREIEKAGKTAAQLTRQLLAFSRREIVEPIVLDVNEIVSGMDKMLYRLVGEHIEMTTELAPRLDRVKADRGQMEQVVLNLTINARDAMTQGGRLTIQTDNVHLPDGVVSTYLAAPPGDYVMIAVRDEGGGMSPAVLQHLFEPFFTTKVTGKGTGLGLATVYGIVKQGHGGIAVESQVGQGSTLRIYLPRCDEEPTPAVADAAASRATVGGATILIVEDDPGIRELAAKVLGRYGYQVLTANGGDEARDICERHGGPIDVLLSDIVMPGMNGPTVAAMLKTIRPALKVVFMSGYTDDAIVRHGVKERDVPFLQKPFSPEQLVNKILEVLDKPS